MPWRAGATNFAPAWAERSKALFLHAVTIEYDHAAEPRGGFGRKESNEMVRNVILGAVALLAAVFVVRSIPDLVRYIKISKM